MAHARLLLCDCSHVSHILSCAVRFCWRFVRGGAASVPYVCDAEQHTHMPPMCVRALLMRAWSAAGV